VSNKKVILVTGANGQMGMELRQLEKFYPEFVFLFADRSQLSIENSLSIHHFFTKHKIDFCINCAAYTAVDKAETEREEALKINGFAVGELAKECLLKAVKFIHFSTDYVFDGLSHKPYEVDSPTNPVNYYGYSKLIGEQKTLLNNPNSIIIRTSWVYSQFGKNFVKTMLQLMNQRPSINVVSDQLGRPTYAADIVEVVMKIIASENWQPGIYHCTNSGDTISWFNFAEAIQRLGQLDCIVKPIPTSEYPTPAKRPAFSTLDIEKIETIFSVQLPEWKTSLTKCIQILLKK